MIAGSLLVAVLVGRELFRATDPDGRGARILGAVLPPVAIGFALVAVVRLAGLVVGGA
jgi:hypothetical protein